MSVKRITSEIILFLGIIGPGLITAFADNDAGGVATYSVSAAKFGYSMLFTLIPITVVLLITQEIGSRIAIVSKKGLADLIRERYGIRISVMVFLLLAFVNFAVILQDVSGLKSALQLFNLDIRIFLPLSLLILIFFVIKSSYSKIEKFFLFLILFYLTYLFSAIKAAPDWGYVAKSLVIPPKKISFDYIYTSIAVLGTTVTAWGQFFINSYVKDKRLQIKKLKYNQLEIAFGAVLTNVFTLFMMVAVIATIWAHGLTIEGAAEASQAIKPIAGNFAGIMFGFGLIIAGLLGSAIVPLATAYAFSEFFGYEGSLDTDFKKSRFFYLFFIIQIGLGMLISLIPSVSLFKITLYADFLNGIFLPLIFFFLYNFSNDAELMGQFVNSRLQNILLVGSGIVITIGALAGGIGKFFGM